MEPMSHPTPLRNVFREDVVQPGLAPEAALAGAPASEAAASVTARAMLRNGRVNEPGPASSPSAAT